MGILSMLGKVAKEGIKLIGSELVSDAKEIVKTVGKDLTNTANKKAHDYIEKKTSSKDKQKKQLQLSEKSANGEQLSNTVENKREVAQESKKEKLSFDEQMRILRNLNELLKDGIITQEEFDLKKKEILSS